MVFGSALDSTAETVADLSSPSRNFSPSRGLALADQILTEPNHQDNDSEGNRTHSAGHRRAQVHLRRGDDV